MRYTVQFERTSGVLGGKASFIAHVPEEMQFSPDRDKDYVISCWIEDFRQMVADFCRTLRLPQSESVVHLGNLDAFMQNMEDLKEAA